MIYRFNVLSTPAAKVRMGLKINDIIKGIVTEAEKLALQENESAVFELQSLELKVVVQFVHATIQVMTVLQAQEAGISDKR